VLFQEIPPAIHLAIEDFIAKHPGFELPALTSRIAGLDAHVKDSLITPAKKGRSPFSHFFIIFLTLSLPVTANAAALRPEKRPKRPRLRFVPVSFIRSGFLTNSSSHRVL